MLEIDSIGNGKSWVLTELERGCYGNYMLREHTSGCGPEAMQPWPRAAGGGA